MKKVIVLMVVIFTMALTLAACGKNDDTIQSCIVSNSSYTSKSKLDSASQGDTLTANKPIYTSIHFIESPKGMKYSVKWYIDGTEIKSETKATEKDVQDIVIYGLEAEKAVKGSLKIQVIYKDTILLTKKLSIK